MTNSHWMYLNLNLSRVSWNQISVSFSYHIFCFLFDCDCFAFVVSVFLRFPLSFPCLFSSFYVSKALSWDVLLLCPDTNVQNALIARIYNTLDRCLWEGFDFLYSWYSVFSFLRLFSVRRVSNHQTLWWGQGPGWLLLSKRRHMSIVWWSSFEPQRKWLCTSLKKCS